MTTLLYMYGVVPEDSPEPPGDLTGLEGRPVRLVRAGGVAAPVSELPSGAYGDEEIDRHLDDLAWVGERGLAHERVLDWFTERAAVVPLSLFSLHESEERVKARLEEESERLHGLLRDLAGKREWGVKLWRPEAASERIDELSPALKSLSAEMEDARPGRRFLLSKKREALRSEELRRVAARVAHLVYAGLGECASRAASIPLPPQTQPGGRALVLHAAFLVPDDGFATFQQRLSELAGEFRQLGFDFEFTGPWPPYHFTDADGG